MAKIKLSESVPALFGKSGGSCFQTSSKSVTLKNNAHMRIFRTPRQKKISEYFISGTRHWHNLGSTGQANWLAFAEFLPQPQIRVPALSISAYENFVKRNTYLQMSNSDANLWMDSPALVEYEKDTLSTLCNVGPDSISLDCQFVNNDSHLDCLLFLSGIQSAGEEFIHTVYRYMATIANSSQSIDITEVYLANFGVLPAIGSKLFFSVVFCGSDNGQFWFPENTSVIAEPLEVIFVHPSFGSQGAGSPCEACSLATTIFGELYTYASDGDMHVGLTVYQGRSGNVLFAPVGISAVYDPILWRGGAKLVFKVEGTTAGVVTSFHYCSDC